MSEQNVQEFPAPWKLSGKGYIVLYRLKRGFVDKEGFVPEFLKGRFAGGFGAVMLVNYETSDAGPYGELLFIPGKFKFGKKKLNTISKIYVSTTESVVNGRKNWGIPKEKADFKFIQGENGRETVNIEKDGEEVASFEFIAKGMKFPVSTRLLPFPLVQKYEGKYYFTNFSGKGKGKFAKPLMIRVKKGSFPDVSEIKPLAAIKVEPFDIVFPNAASEDAND